MAITKITIDGKEMTIQEAKELYDELALLFGNDVVYYPSCPQPIGTPQRPWYTTTSWSSSNLTLQENQ